MRGLEAIASAVSNLAEAVRSLAVALAQSDRPTVRSEAKETELGEWELIEEQSSVPGASVGFNATIKFELESGVPPTPQFLVDLAKKKLRSSVSSPEDRARAAFCAGYWYRLAILCSVSLDRSYEPVLPPSTWLVQKGEGISDLARLSTRREAAQLCQGSPRATIVEGFPSLTELQILCAGAQVPVPPLLRWRSEQ